MLMDWNPRTPSLWDWDSSSFFFSTSGNASSSKSTISTSIESSSLYAAPPQQEPPLGLKLGKRTYFEDVCGGKNMAASSNSSSPASGEIKRARAPPQSVQIFRCQVEGCNLDLSGFKEYHRKHRVCESHSKCPRVIVAGQERRFCQQCSRFHDLAAFDDKKRSCRKRLSDHNARRRKPQPRTISFNSERLPSPFYDNKQQINLLLESAPFGHIRPPASSTWEGSFDFKLAHMKGLKGESEGQLLLPGTGLSNAFSTLRHDFDRVMSFKGTTAEILNQGCEEEAAASMVASCLNGAPSYLGRALSLLSTDSSWVSAEPGPPTAQHVIDNSASHCWHDEHPHLAQPPQLVLPFSMHGNNDSSSNSQFQEFQLLKPQPFATTFFDSSEIH